MVVKKSFAFRVAVPANSVAGYDQLLFARLVCTFCIFIFVLPACLLAGGLVRKRHWYSKVVVFLVKLCMKITVFWDVVPCSMVEVYRGYCCLNHQGDVQVTLKS
jgi:hypothetical protein